MYLQVLTPYPLGVMEKALHCFCRHSIRQPPVRYVKNEDEHSATTYSIKMIYLVIFNKYYRSLSQPILSHIGKANSQKFKVIWLDVLVMTVACSLVKVCACTVNAVSSSARHCTAAIVGVI